MTQKDNVKQLIGKSLNAYNNKVLQQIDRIEKKNKQQNHKINMLTNELDNDYLTKTEEGSVVSLEHSKEGMVYLDELQGNTLVNYCTDGSKELTLNGDIDLEGTFITTTEGVDNGLVDVYCEGNTLVNLIEDANILFQKGFGGSLGTLVSTNVIPSRCCIEIHNVKPNVSYTIIPFNKSPYHGLFILDENNTNLITPTWRSGIYTFTTPANTNYLGFSFKLDENDTNFTNISQILENYLLIEGDWTNKEIPPYFEGMKSVGQDDENGHKIEILSRNDNLFVPTQYIPNGWSNGNMIVNLTNFRSYWIECKPNTTYFVESDKSGNRFGVSCSDRIELNGVAFPVTKGSMYGSSDDTDKVQSTIFTTDATAKYLYVYTTNNGIFPTPKIMISEGSSMKAYIEPKLNKKEILLNEPLRGLPNGVKDRFVKIGGKCYIERNCKEVVFLEEYIDHYYGNFSNIKKIHIGEDVDWNTNSMVMCDKFVYKDWGSKSPECISTYNNDTLRIYSDIYNSIDLLKGLIRDKGIKMVFKLLTPTYEPLEVEPTLNTYNDITHISNNSIIPCNMKIQNTGYNAIIKPSTLYTITLDTNKSGTIGMNLGGTKGTTTNNILTLTTPATLTDDSLRLHGKGIKGSKVRLLEGDKTNWIPSYFDGMKSSFEDKFDATDNTYKMEILSKNKNIFDIDKFINENKSERYLNGFNCNFNEEKILHSQFKRNTRYIIRCDFDIYDDSVNVGWSPILGIQFEDGLRQEVYLHQKNYIVATTGNRTIEYIYVRNPWRTYTYIYNISIHEDIQNFEYIKPKQNKIQFSSIEPLRKWDRFVFKNSKLMIERYSKKVDLGVDWSNKQKLSTGIHRYTLSNVEGIYSMAETLCNTITGVTISDTEDKKLKYGTDSIWYQTFDDFTLEELKEFFVENNTSLIFKLKEPTYEEISYELQKIILEGYGNGTLFFDTNIPPTSTITYAGETPIVKATKLNKTEVLNNTNDINDNIIPYLMDMDYRVVCLQLESNVEGISMAKLFGGAYEMLKRDILSKRLTKEEYGYRLTDYFNAGKLTEQEVRELEDLR